MYIDNRGKLIFPIKYANFNVKESTVSINNKNVFRGIHIEQFEKLVTCIQGKILDIIINFNKDEEDYLKPKYILLDANDEKNNQILVKKNYGHAFLSMEDNSIVLYHFSDIYDAKKTITINYKDELLNIKLPISENNIIISEKDKNGIFISLYEKIEPNDIDYIIYGGKGFIGSVIVEELKSKKKNFYVSDLRLEDYANIENEIDKLKPKYIINSAGITGNPNISWCETNKEKTIETNIIYQLTLAKLCNDRGIHLTIVGSGAIFDDKKYYSEEEEGNFFGNFYGICRIYLENIVKCYKNVLYLRIIYPFSKYKSNKNLITKLLTYKYIEKKQLCMTYIDELIPYMLDMIEKKEIGICNMINHGSIDLTYILEVYNKYKIHLYTVTESIDKSKSNSLLSIGKLNNYNVMHIKDAIDDCIKNYIALNN